MYKQTSPIYPSLSFTIPTPPNPNPKRKHIPQVVVYPTGRDWRRVQCRYNLHPFQTPFPSHHHQTQWTHLPKKSPHNQHLLPEKHWSRHVTKPTKWHVRPAKTQISLGIRPVWSESLLCAQWVAMDLSFLRVDSEDSDRTGRMPRLIWVFARHTGNFVGFVMRWLIAIMMNSGIFIQLTAILPNPHPTTQAQNHSQM